MSMSITWGCARRLFIIVVQQILFVKKFCWRPTAIVFIPSPFSWMLVEWWRADPYCRWYKLEFCFTTHWLSTEYAMETRPFHSRGSIYQATSCSNVTRQRSSIARLEMRQLGAHSSPRKPWPVCSKRPKHAASLQWTNRPFGRTCGTCPMTPD